MNLEIQMLVDKKESLLVTLSNITFNFPWHDIDEEYLKKRQWTLYDTISDIDIRLNYLYSLQNNDR